VFYTHTATETARKQKERERERRRAATYVAEKKKKLQLGECTGKTVRMTSALAASQCNSLLIYICNVLECTVRAGLSSTEGNPRVENASWRMSEGVSTQANTHTVKTVSLPLRVYVRMDEFDARRVKENKMRRRGWVRFLEEVAQ
jgi:hypothetical protein